MKRVFPAPLLSAAVAIVWLLMVNSLAPAHLLAAAVLGWLLPLPAQRLRHENHLRLRRPVRALRLGGRVLVDIVTANLEIAVRILGPESRIRPAFIWVPLDIQNPYGIATLAGIITMTPGTLSSELSADRRHLLVHCFHVDDPDAAIADIKQRYERPLREIFQ